MNPNFEPRPFAATEFNTESPWLRGEQMAKSILKKFSKIPNFESRTTLPPFYYSDKVLSLYHSTRLLHKA